MYPYARSVCTKCMPVVQFTVYIFFLRGLAKLSKICVVQYIPCLSTNYCTALAHDCPNSMIGHHETFSFVMSLPTVSLKDRLRWFTRRVKKAWLCLCSAVERPRLALRGPFLSKWTEKQGISPCRDPISSVQGLFLRYTRSWFFKVTGYR